MSLPRGVVRAIALLHASVIPLGCWTVCKETTELKDVYSINVEREADGRLIELGGLYRTFADCRAVCEAQGGLIEFRSCKISRVPRDASAPTRESVAVECDGLWASCKSVPTSIIGGGRAPEGYTAIPSGAYLAECARMEGAAAIAFERLARELETHGAPASLLAAAWRAADDEKRHAKLMGAVAETFGETHIPYEATSLPPRPLLAVALENAREGVVHETFGAVLNAHQAEHAEGASLRDVFASIADDELAHAQLSLDIHRWVLTQLPPDERLMVVAEVTRAITNVGKHVAAEGDRDPHLGLPARETSRSILASLSEKVWNACV